MPVSVLKGHVTSHKKHVQHFPMKEKFLEKQNSLCPKNNKLCLPQGCGRDFPGKEKPSVHSEDLYAIVILKLYYCIIYLYIS